MIGYWLGRIFTWLLLIAALATIGYCLWVHVEWSDPCPCGARRCLGSKAQRCIDGRWQTVMDCSDIRYKDGTKYKCVRRYGEMNCEPDE